MFEAGDLYNRKRKAGHGPETEKFRLDTHSEVSKEALHVRPGNLLVAVRGGAHNGPGLSSVDDGLVIDLSAMRGVVVDPDARIAHVLGGTLLGEVDQLLVLLTPQSTHDEDQLGNYLVSGHLDGAMLVSLHGADPLPSFLAERGVPVVVGGRPAPGTAVDSAEEIGLQRARHRAGRHRRTSARRRCSGSRPGRRSRR